MHQLGFLAKRVSESERSGDLLNEALQWLLFLVGLLFSILGWSDFVTMGGASSLMAMVLPTIGVMPPLHPLCLRFYKRFFRPYFRYLRRHDAFLRMVVCLASGIALLALYQDPRPQVSQLNLCPQILGDVCPPSPNQFTTTQVPQLFASGQVTPPQWGQHLKLQVTYMPEPSRSEAIVNTTLSPDRQGDRFNLALPLKSPLGVGSYQVTLTPLGKDTRSGTTGFRVWPSDHDLAQRQTLPQDPIAVQKVILCDRQDCETNLDTFPSTLETLVFRVTFGGSTQAVPITFKLYQYPTEGTGEPKIIHETTKTVAAQLTDLNYSLHVRGNLPAGRYAEVIALDTANAQPIFKPFTITTPDAKTRQRQA